MKNDFVNRTPDPNPGSRNEGRTIGTVVSELALSLKHVMQSEIRLAKAEITDAGTQVGRHVGQMILFGVIAALGVLPLIAFLVIGLGDLLGDRYWLSSLIIAVIFIAVGGALAFRALKEMRVRDLSLPRTRETLDRQADIVEHTVQDVSEATNRRRVA